MTHTLEGREAPQAAAMGVIRSSSGAPEAVHSGAPGPSGIGRQVTRPGQLPAATRPRAAMQLMDDEMRVRRQQPAAGQRQSPWPARDTPGSAVPGPVIEAGRRTCGGIESEAG